jgi:hypothetical protein
VLFAGVATAGAAVGGAIAGNLSCSRPGGSFATHITTSTPQVSAANTTASVDYQWVYWHAAVFTKLYDVTGAHFTAVTSWSQWAAVRAADNAWTTNFVFTDGPQKGMSARYGLYWDLGMTGGLSSDWYVLNEFWYLNSNGTWDHGSLWSKPGSGSGNDGGVGYCPPL